MSDAGIALYSAAQVRALDACAIGEHRISGERLMARAAAAAYDRLRRRWPSPEALHVVCGTGNNGGDGFLLALLAHGDGLPVTVYQVGDPARINGDALSARDQLLAGGVRLCAWDAAALVAARGVLVDALLGTGISGEVHGERAAVIRAINACGLPVLALDTPSGLCPDTGRVLGVAVRAQATVSFIGRKRGHYTLEGPEHCGDRQFDALAVPDAVFGAVPAAEHWELMQLPRELSVLAPRPGIAHKGWYGRVLVLGGDLGMGGAALMAAEAALRSGAGLVRVATRAEHVPAVLARLPEAMPAAVDSVHTLAPLLAAADVLVLGPGLGRSSWSQQLFLHALGSGLPMVVDADALGLLARRADRGAWQRADCVITPHPGEAAALLGISTAAVQADRFAAADALHRRYGAAAVLKGNGSLVCGQDGARAVCAQGNPGMASGGMGDVLAGLVGGLLAQGLGPVEAARLGVCVHAAAGDLAAADGQCGLLATDLMPHLRRLLG
jgi:NAD(P)H-hydrate epimerase